MNDNKNFQTITQVVVLMLLFAGEASASFKHCFPGCAISCLFGGHKLFCVVKCFAKCLTGEGFSSGFDYCKLGCAVDQCTPFADDFKMEDVEKVNRCVNECEIGECGLLPQQMASSSSPPR
ncbi:protein TAP1 [Sesamum indicum]|uniref:Protein TAP1 n=1 Tax=Sesamum indicum TaxID=4182 RepID=A0A6I9SQ11_SESIN|nr:protein TAP1 [Sesamum indicum]